MSNPETGTNFVTNSPTEKKSEIARWLTWIFLIGNIVCFSLLFYFTYKGIRKGMILITPPLTLCVVAFVAAFTW